MSLTQAAYEAEAELVCLVSPDRHAMSILIGTLLDLCNTNVGSIIAGVFKVSVSMGREQSKCAVYIEKV